MATLLLGGWLYLRGQVTLGDVTAATLYVQMLVDPVDRVVADPRRVPGRRSLAGPAARCRARPGRPGRHRPSAAGEQLEAEDVRFAYAEGRDVLHGVDLSLRVGERLAMVGPSGAGKSTLGRLLAGIHPPRTGSVTVGGVGLTELPLDDLRGHVALVTQEHHVFVGTLRENLALGRRPRRRPTTRLMAALAAVDAAEWVAGSPTDSTPSSARAVARSGPPRRSSSRWPGWCWPTRTRWCSTRRPR